MLKKSWFFPEKINRKKSVACDNEEIFSEAQKKIISDKPLELNNICFGWLFVGKKNTDVQGLRVQ